MGADGSIEMVGMLTNGEGACISSAAWMAHSHARCLGHLGYNDDTMPKLHAIRAQAILLHIITHPH